MIDESYPSDTVPMSLIRAKQMAENRTIDTTQPIYEHIKPPKLSVKWNDDND